MVTINDRDPMAAWRNDLSTAATLGFADMAERYAIRVGLATPRSSSDGLSDALKLVTIGRGDLLEPTVVCDSAPLRTTYILGSPIQAFYLVAPEFGDALAESRASLELRTPPSVWTSVPPSCFNHDNQQQDDVLIHGHRGHVRP